MKEVKSDCRFYEYSSVTFQKNESLGARKRKTNSRSWPCELNEGRSLLEINCVYRYTKVFGVPLILKGIMAF